MIIPELPENELIFDNDWLELVDLTKPGGSTILSHDKSEDTIEVLISANKVRSLNRQVLGYATADTGSPYRLRRPETPICHPTLPWLWANAFAYELVQPKANTLKPHPDFPGFFVPQDDAIQYVGYGPRTTAKYRYAKCTIRYGEVDYPIYPETDLNWNNPAQYPAGQPEYMRFLGLSGDNALTPKAEIVSAEGAADSQNYFAETDNPPGLGPNLSSAAAQFKGSVYVYKTTCAFTLVWKCVPESYCCVGPSQMPYPRRLLNGLGKVNNSAMFGSTEYPRDTLLFEGLRGKRYQLPVRTDTTTGLHAWDWYLTWNHFRPERPTTVVDKAGAVVTDRADGHQLRPWLLSRFWYYATRGSTSTRGTYAGQAAVTRIEFADLFKSASDPS